MLGRVLRWSLGPSAVGQGPVRFAGHSKWANIKHEKGAADKKRAALFMKLLREIKTATRVGGVNPEANPRLATAIAAARQSSVPKEKINAAIFPDNEATAEILFEAMAPGGIGLLIKAEAESRTHAAPNIRRVLTKNSCTLGNAASVSWMFDAKGVIVADLDHPDLKRDAEEVAIEVGAESVEIDQDGGNVTFLCARPDFNAVQTALEDRNIVLSYAEIEYIPHTFAATSEAHVEAAEKIVQKLEELDEVTSVATNIPSSTAP